MSSAGQKQVWKFRDLGGLRVIATPRIRPRVWFDHGIDLLYMNS